MREIKFLGTYRKEGTSRSYQYSLFECSICHKKVEKIRRDGLKPKLVVMNVMGNIVQGNGMALIKTKY